MNSTDKEKLKVLSDYLDCSLSDIEFVPYTDSEFEVTDSNGDVQPYMVLSYDELEEALVDKIRDKKRYGTSYEDLFEDFEDWIKDHADQDSFYDNCVESYSDYIRDMTIDEFVNACCINDLADSSDFEKGGNYDITSDDDSDYWDDGIWELFMESGLFGDLVHIYVESAVPDGDYIDWYMDYMGYTISELVAKDEIDLDEDDLAEELLRVYSNYVDLICNLFDYYKMDNYEGWFIFGR